VRRHVKCPMCGKSFHCLRVDKTAIPLSMVPRTAPSNGEIRQSQSLSMVDRRGGRLVS